MNRQLTNIIRFFMDECLPAIIRDNKYFMLPFYVMAYRGKHIDKAMDFKSLVHGMSEQEYKDFYSGLDSMSRNRVTDLNPKSLDFIVSQVDDNIHSIIDVGCGSGYLLKYLYYLFPHKNYFGCDILDPPESVSYGYIQGDIQNLDIEDKSYDLVTCCHTLEHIVDLKKSIKELVRICRKKLVIVVPCQRYFYYTLDEHINFFSYQYQLEELMGIDLEKIEAFAKLWGDWNLFVDCEESWVSK